METPRGLGTSIQPTVSPLLLTYSRGTWGQKQPLRTHFLGCKSLRDHPSEPHVGGSQHLHGKHLSFGLCCLDGWMIAKGLEREMCGQSNCFLCVFLPE